MKLGIIGYGKMGKAFVEGISKSNIYASEDIKVYTRNKNDLNGLKLDQISSSIDDLIYSSDIILICVKPAQMFNVLENFQSHEEKLIISIVAGIRIQSIKKHCGEKHKIIRVMPNTPSLILKGVSGYSVDNNISKEEDEIAYNLLNSVGYVCKVQEDQIDALTAVSGSGPAYFFLMIESMIKAGIKLGLPEGIAKEIVNHTASGACQLSLNSEKSPEQLRIDVTSPNGTTQKALESFKKNNFSEIIYQAISSAKNRSEEIGKL